MVKAHNVEAYVMEGLNVKLDRKEFFNEKDIVEGSGTAEWQGQIIVMSEYRLKEFREMYQKPVFQLWRCDGGFGSSPDTVGSAVYCTSCADDEETRFNRQDFIGILKPELVKMYGLEEGDNNE